MTISGSILKLAMHFCPWERHFKHVFLWGEAFYRLWWPSRTKDLQIEPNKALSVGMFAEMLSMWYILINERIALIV